MSIRMSVALTLGLAVAGACAPASTRPVGSSNVISQAELEKATQTNLLDLVKVLRPNWLEYRGNTSFTRPPEIAVYLNGTRIGGTDDLASLSPADVVELRHYNATQAQYRFGVGNVNGAIDVITEGG